MHSFCLLVYFEFLSAKLVEHGEKLYYYCVKFIHFGACFLELVEVHILSHLDALKAIDVPKLVMKDLLLRLHPFF